MTWTYFGLVLVAWFGSTYQQANAPSPDFIATFFGRRPTRTVAPEKADKPCECVPYYLCSENHTITDGAGIFNDSSHPHTYRINDEDDQTKCPSYLDVCCRKEFVMKKRSLPDPLPQRKGCGYRHEHGVGFKIDRKHGEANFGELPWMVAIFSKELASNGSEVITYKCGGALIHPGAAITAAHCVGSAKQYRVRAGEWDTQTTLEIFPHQEVPVKEVIVHPKFLSEGLHNDIALLILDEEVEYRDHIAVICLPPQDYVVPDGTKCLASYWGDKDALGKGEVHDPLLKKFVLPYVERNRCQEQLRATKLGKHFILDKSLVCAGGQKEGLDTCKGAGGSPLVCPVPGQPNRYLHAGIVAWGMDCGLSDVPATYANVALFRNWIDEQMISHQLDPSEYQY